MRKKYKYLNYVPVPVHLKSTMYDLVDDEVFCCPDGRIPILIVTQFGVFPSKGSYKGKKDYCQLRGLENQTVGFIRRAYLSDRETSGMTLLELDSKTLEKIRRNNLT